jgi:hypothetical protein
MIFKKDNLVLGLVLGMVAPLIGLVIFKYYKFEIFTFKEVFQYLFFEPDHRMLSAALSVSLLLNALLFTIYINTSRDRTAVGIFITTVVYGLVILSIKTFG